MAEYFRLPRDTMTDALAKAGKEDFHRERSRFLDAFAGLEERLPSTIKDKQLTDEIKSLRSVRNDLVHSQLRFVQLEGQLQAVAVNAQNSTDFARQGRLLRIDDFKMLSAQLLKAQKNLQTAA
jgi:hypothetical protein